MAQKNLPPTKPPNGAKDRDAVVKDLVDKHFEIEPELQAVYVMPPKDAVDLGEPIAMLEVNVSTVPTGSITPFTFSPSAGVPFPVLIAEVTPEEFSAAKAGTLALPKGWSVDSARKFDRPQNK